MSIALKITLTAMVLFITIASVGRVYVPHYMDSDPDYADKLSYWFALALSIDAVVLVTAAIAAVWS